MSDTTEKKYFARHTGIQLDSGIDMAEESISKNKSGQTTAKDFSLQVKGAMTFKNTNDDQYSAPLTVDDYELQRIWDSQNSIVVRKTRRLVKKRENTSDLIIPSDIVIDYTLAGDLNPEDYYIVMEVCRRNHSQYEWQIPETSYGDKTEGERDRRLGYVVLAGKKLQNLGRVSSTDATVVTRTFHYADVPNWMSNGGCIDPKITALTGHSGSVHIKNNFFLPLIKPILPSDFEDTTLEVDGGTVPYNYFLNFDKKIVDGSITEENANDFGLFGVNDDKKPLLIRFGLYKVTKTVDDYGTEIIQINNRLAISQIVAIGKPRKTKNWFTLTWSASANEGDGGYVGEITNLYRYIK